MMSKLIKLPSGREIEIRSPTALDLYRVQGVLPDLGADADAATKVKPRDAMKSGIALICAVSVKPRFWADLDNPDADPPEGRTLFDLDMEDFAEVMRVLNEVQGEAAEKIRPLSVTGTDC